MTIDLSANELNPMVFTKLPLSKFDFAIRFFFVYKNAQRISKSILYYLSDRWRDFGISVTWIDEVYSVNIHS